MAMKTIKKFILTPVIATVAILGLFLLLSRCTKTNTVTKTVTVTDTIGKATYNIVGNVTYPNMSGVMVPAKGAVLQLYVGTPGGTPAATTYSDSSGNYSFNGLIAGTYVIDATYNTANTNNNPINGINFLVSDISVTVTNANVPQPIALQTATQTGNVNLSIVPADTNGSDGKILAVKLEDHSTASFNVEFTDSQSIGMTFAGTFGNNSTPMGFMLNTFRFNQASPSTSYFNGYVLNRMVETGCPARDTGWAALYTKDCETVFWGRDTFAVGGGWPQLIESTDTAFYWANAGQISTYGTGYLAKGTLAPVWKASGTKLLPPRTTMPRPDTNGKYNGQLGWDKRIQATESMYFEYQGVKDVYKNDSTYTPYYEFGGQMTFNRNTFYMVASVGDVVTVNVNLQFTGATVVIHSGRPRGASPRNAHQVSTPISKPSQLNSAVKKVNQPNQSNIINKH